MLKADGGEGSEDEPTGADDGGAADEDERGADAAAAAAMRVGVLPEDWPVSCFRRRARRFENQT